MQAQDFVQDLNDRYFNGELSKSFTDSLSTLPVDRPDVLAFVDRMFRYIVHAGIPPQDLSAMLGDILGSLLARILPGAWEGRIPPITIPGRHEMIDNYLKNNPWITASNKSMLDIGCGFPPHTTLESSASFPDWHITGVDPSLPHYLLYDAEGNYATLDETKTTAYFQPAVPTVENWNNLLEDSLATKSRFETLLLEMLNAPDKQNEDLPKLEIDPIKSYEAENLKFVRGKLGEVIIAPKDVIRCFNLMFYFDDQFYESALEWFSNQLNEGGLLLIGGNWAVSTECYFNVYQKVNGLLISREFCFGLDCICPVGIVTWYANHDDNRQSAQLADFVKVIRQDKDFMQAFYEHHDARRKVYGICPRDEQGYYGMVDPSVTPGELWFRARKLMDDMNEAGLNQGAVNVLLAEGFNARVNEVGQIAISV